MIPERRAAAKDPAVDHYLRTATRWGDELKRLRIILLDSPLKEEFKWGYPCYTFANSNLIGINKLKDYCALGFFKGALLKDEKGILIKPGENSQSMRQARFTSVREIVEMEPTLKAYIREAIAAEKAGLKVDFKASIELVYPEEFQRKLDEFPALKKAFDALTPGRRRAYNIYFSAPKHSETRESRIEKCLQPILHGKGLNDCSCGWSKRQPYCDGSHRHLW